MMRTSNGNSAGTARHIGQDGPGAVIVGILIAATVCVAVAYFFAASDLTPAESGWPGFGTVLNR